MLSNIEQAVIDLLGAKITITVPNVFSAYIRIAGLDVDAVDEAVTTFERALDKHALRPDVVQSPMIAKLRNQYWYSKLGGCSNGSGTCKTCEHCGGMKLSDGKQGDSEAVAQPETQRASQKVKTKKPKRVRVCSKAIYDPYAPSTSAACL